MNARQKTPTTWLALGIAWLTVQVLLQRRGLLVHDTRLDLLLNPREFLARLSDVWDARADMGRVQNQAVGYLFPMGPVLLLGHLLAIPAWITERLWMALLLGLAFWGTARLADELAIGVPATRLLAAASYALAPFFIARVGNTSVFVQGAALLPWVLLPLVRGARGGSPRRAAFQSGIAILVIGGVNATTAAAVLLVPAVWLLTRERGPRRRSLCGWWVVAVGCATAWWAAALLLQGRYGIDFLPLTERTSLTTAPTSPFEIIRGSADWLSHIVLDVPLLPSGWTLVSSRPVIAATGLVSALGVFGLARRDLPERRFLVTTVLIGVALVGAGYGGVFGNPFASQVAAFLDGPGGALRTVYKFQPVVMLPLAMGVAAGADVVVTSVGRFRSAKTAYEAGALLVLGALVLGSAQPLFAGDLLNAKPFSRVPDWWTQAADSIAGAPGRTLLLPGLPQADFTWGYTAEEPLSWLTNESWASRSLIPLGSYGAIQYLDAVEKTVARAGDRQLGSYLLRGGFARVMVRNDGNWRTYGAPPPNTVNDALTASGFLHTASFGPTLDDSQAGASPGVHLHQLEMYAVPGATAEPRITTYAAADTAVVSGDPSAPLTLGNWNLADRGLILAGDVRAGETLPRQWIVTDGNQRRFTNFGTTHDNRSYVLTADENAPAGVPAGGGLYPGSRVQDETVTVRDGIASVRASSSGSLLTAEPGRAPDRALDHDPATAWAPAVEHPLAGQWLQVDLLKPTAVSSIDVQLLTPIDHADAVRSLRVTTEQGAAVINVDQGASTQHLAARPGVTSWIRVTLESTDPAVRTAGIRELTIPGVTVAQSLRTPSQLASTFSDPTRPMPVYVFSRGLANPVSGNQEDAETSLQRRLTVPHAGLVQVDAKATALPGSAALDLLDSTAGFSISTSSTFGSMPRFAPRNLIDGDDTSTWAAGVLADGITPDRNPQISMRWSEPRLLDRIVVRSAPGSPLPRSVHITTSTGARTAELSSDGSASFAPITTDQVDVHFDLPTTSADATRRVALSTLEFPALRDLEPGRIDPSQVVTVECSQGLAVDVAGTPRRFSVRATLDDVINQRAVDAAPCDESPVSLPAGQQDLSSLPSTSLFVISEVRLIEPQLARATTLASTRSAQVRKWNDESREVVVGLGDATYLAVNENANEGWHATLNGRALESVVLDGWRQGYLVPAGEGGVVQLRYEPTTLYRAGLIAGLVLVLLLMLGRFLPDRRAVPVAIEEGRWPRWLAIGGPGVLAIVIGGPLALLVVALFALQRPAARWIPAVVAVLLVGATVGATVRYGLGSGLWGTNGKVVSALVVGALAALATTLLPAAKTAAKSGTTYTSPPSQCRSGP